MSSADFHEAAKKARDTRPPLKASAVAEALTTAASKILRLERERFNLPPAWPSLRSTFHALPDDARRLMLLKLLLEEAHRIDLERAT